MSFLLMDNCYPKCSLTPQHISRSPADKRGGCSRIERRLKPKRFLRRKNWASQCICSITGCIAVDTYSCISQNLSLLLHLSDGLQAGSSVSTKQRSSSWLHCLKWENCPFSCSIHCTCSCYSLYPKASDIVQNATSKDFCPNPAHEVKSSGSE